MLIMTYSKLIPWVGYMPSHNAYADAICDSGDEFVVRTDLTNTTLALENLRGTLSSPLIIDANAWYNDGRSQTYVYALEFLAQLRESRSDKQYPVVIFSPEPLFDYDKIDFVLGSPDCYFIDGGQLGSQNLVSKLRSYYPD